MDHTQTFHLESRLSLRPNSRPMNGTSLRKHPFIVPGCSSEFDRRRFNITSFDFEALDLASPFSLTVILDLDWKEDQPSVSSKDFGFTDILLILYLKWHCSIFTRWILKLNTQLNHYRLQTQLNRSHINVYYVWSSVENLALVSGENKGKNDPTNQPQRWHPALFREKFAMRWYRSRKSRRRS